MALCSAVAQSGALFGGQPGMGGGKQPSCKGSRHIPLQLPVHPAMCHFLLDQGLGGWK